jgi:hypothetical protein
MNHISSQEHQENEQLRKINRNMMAVLFLAAMPSISLMAIGSCWNLMSAPVAVTSVISLCIMTLGSIIAASIRFDW